MSAAPPSASPPVVAGTVPGPHGTSLGRVHLDVRAADRADLDVLVELYREAEAEQAALRPSWPIAAGLDEPIRLSFERILDAREPLLFVGLVDGVVVGFAWATIEPLRTQARGRPLGVIRLIYTHPEARGVGVGDLVLDRLLAELRERGVDLFDALVSPGHREAKNFFETHGFKARLIVMHRDEHGAG